MTIPEIYAFKSTPTSFLGQLMDCTDPTAPVPYDLTGWDRVYIIFKKPDGTQWPTDEQIAVDYDQGAIVEDVATPGDPPILTDANIKLTNATLPSILDQKGPWEYTPAAMIDNSLVKSPLTVFFLVQ